MELILNDEEIKESTLDDFINGNDHSKITIVGENSGKRHEGRDEITKEIIANDALMLGSQRAAELHGITQPSASKYKDGLDIADDETRNRVLAKKYDIAETATAKLMETLGLFSPHDIDKPMDKIRAAAMLSGIVEKVSDKGRGNGNNIQLHLYMPKQTNISKYGDVIDV